MATKREVVTTRIISQDSEIGVEEINIPDELALAVEKFQTKPLWTRMAKLNPPLPCVVLLAFGFKANK